MTVQRVRNNARSTGHSCLRDAIRHVACRRVDRRVGRSDCHCWLGNATHAHIAMARRGQSGRSRRSSIRLDRVADGGVDPGAGVSTSLGRTFVVFQSSGSDVHRCDRCRAAGRRVEYRHRLGCVAAASLHSRHSAGRRTSMLAAASTPRPRAAMAWFAMRALFAASGSKKRGRGAAVMV